ncbi:DNA topoisomerase IB [Rhizobium glycinendophyticum]|uniref:DNA topoisomerase n=1 Tax=Rhizobium glycinendophyticum TaxID=2589807 RepID=A0A504UJI9_9HYPH|nr:DNA topoisomerase IB [Rhizobium glycinendophyticum]TPP07041.1 DNA topoisomerase IB [Rhizobium glycinendophyticum]
MHKPHDEQPLNPLPEDRAELEEIGLVYTSDNMPGITRRRRGGGFSYHLPDGTRLTDETILQRIRRLALPPAYDRVWISLEPRGHLQATGLDARGRKQYRYHADWASWRSTRKFGDLVTFGHALPVIRRRVLRDLEDRTQETPFLLSALVSLLDVTYMRVGNRTYVEENKTYGATTLQKRHLTFEQDGIRLSFKAKGGKRVRRKLRHPRLQKILEEIADLPGRDLFSWRDRDGSLHRIDSGRLNAYLAQITGHSLSAKTFRTWGGSVAAFGEAWKMMQADERPTIRRMCEVASDRLHNTPTICRSSYVHPAILALSDKETDLSAVKAVVSASTGHALMRADENRLMAFLEGGPFTKPDA